MKTAMTLPAALVLAAGLAVPPAPLLAADDNAQPVQTCGKGKVYDEKKKMCVDAQSGIVDDDALIRQAHALAKSGQPHLALDLLDLVAENNEAGVLNIRGFATRKAGEVDAGIGFYQQALALDANNVLVREYLGEAYVTKGKLALASAQLQEIERICGTACKEYRALHKVILDAGGA